MGRLTAFLVLCLPAICAAQAAPELVTDRPGFGESSAVVGRGTIQIETGFTVERPHGEPRHASPEALARLGVASRLELRVAGDRWGAEVGGKVKLLDAGPAPLDVAVIPYVSLEHYDPGFKIAVGRALPRGFGLSGTLNVTDATGDTGRVWQRELSVSLDHGLGGRVGAYWEADGSFGVGTCACSLDTGVTVAVGANGQFDVEVGRGLGGGGQDWFVGAGFVIRHLHR